MAKVSNYYHQVEDLLNEYAYYDPEGYKALHNYVDYKKVPIDVYIGIDSSLKITKQAGTFDYGDYGTVDASPFSINGEFATVKSDKFGMNSIYIKLAPDNYTTTIAHQKGHFESLYFNYKEDIKFTKEGGSEYKAGRHGNGDPSGKRAGDETENFKKKQKVVVREKGYFNKNNPNHIRKY